MPGLLSPNEQDRFIIPMSDLNEEIKENGVCNGSEGQESFVSINGVQIRTLNFQINLSSLERNDCVPFLSTDYVPSTAENEVSHENGTEAVGEGSGGGGGKRKRGSDAVPASKESASPPSKRRKDSTESAKVINSNWKNETKFKEGSVIASLEEMGDKSSGYPVYLIQSTGLIGFHSMGKKFYKKSQDQSTASAMSLTKEKGSDFISISVEGSPMKNSAGVISAFTISYPSKKELEAAKKKKEESGEGEGEKEEKMDEGLEEMELMVEDSKELDKETAKETIENILKLFIESAYERASNGYASSSNLAEFKNAEELCVPKLQHIMEESLPQTLCSYLSNYVWLHADETVSGSEKPCQNEKCGKGVKKPVLVTLSGPYIVDKDTLGGMIRSEPGSNKQMEYYKMYRFCSKCAEDVKTFHLLEHIRWVGVRLMEKKLAEIKCDDPDNHDDWKSYVQGHKETKELTKRIRKIWMEAIPS